MLGKSDAKSTKKTHFCLLTRIMKQASKKFLGTCRWEICLFFLFSTLCFAASLANEGKAEWPKELRNDYFKRNSRGSVSYFVFEVFDRSCWILWHHAVLKELQLWSFQSSTAKIKSRWEISRIYCSVPNIIEFIFPISLIQILCVGGEWDLLPSADHSYLPLKFHFLKSSAKIEVKSLVCLLVVINS